MYGMLVAMALQTVPPGAAQPGPARPAPRKPAPAVRDDDVVLLWNEVLLQAIRADRTPPPRAARNLAMVHVALYDAVNAIDQTHRSFYVQARATRRTSTEVAAAVAAHRVLIDLYPRQARRFDRALDDCLEAVPDGAVKTQGIRLGQYVAGRVLAWRRRDGSDRRAEHRPGAARGVWRPTPPRHLPGLLPGWVSVTPFALRRADQFRPAPPPALTDRRYAADLKEVRDLGGRGSAARTAEQTLIARFWADDAGTVTPPGHWNRIAQAAARSRGNSAADNARLFALLNVALADAGIACWDCKYHYALWRPVTAVREADGDDDPDAGWTPLLVTPPFPSYTSGHSTFSGAAAAALASFFGTDEVRFTTTSDDLPGVERTFARFSDAAAEAGRSRIYGGIHYEFDNVEGLKLGRAVAEYVSRNYLQPRERPAKRDARPDD